MAATARCTVAVACSAGVARRTAIVAIVSLAAACAPPPAAVPEPVAPSLDDVAPPTATPAPTHPELDAITLPPKPAWTDKYHQDGPAARRFRISEVMARHELSRAQAIEVQNVYRDLARADPEADDLDALLRAAIASVRAGTYEDDRDHARLAEARFVVVFDLDETLYDQSLDAAAGPGCHDVVLDTDKGPRWIKLAPGWDAAIRRIGELGGAVVLFTANVDDKTWANARAWTLDGAPIVDGDLVAGLLTNGHLVQQHKDDGEPIQEPSKDLRIVDETLSRAIIVDDNPNRVAQQANLRVVKKFDAAQYCAATDANVRRAYEQSLPRVVWEIEDSLRFMDANPGTTFADAYRPYTVMGQVAVRLARDTLALDDAAAVDWVRSYPRMVDDDF